ncbi:soluble calcium-activated nucleotidase 1 [Sarcoptes scabiei]|nr:soluble calcium-activated nucleotidase 1 [Sarcoptes scabiei]
MKNLSASSSLPSNLKKFSDLNVDLVFEDSVDVGTKHYNDSYDYYSDIDDVDDEKSVRGQHRNGEIRVAVPFDSSTNDKPVVVPYPVMQQSSITLQNPLTDRSFRRESIDSDQSEQKNSVSNISISPAPSHHQSSNSRDHRNNDDHKRGKVLYEYSESMNEIQQKSQQRYREPTVIVSSKPIYMRNEADLHHLSRPTRTKKMTTSKATNAVRMIEQGDYLRPISSMPFPSSSHQREPQQQKQRHLFDLKSSNHSSFDRDLEKNSIPKNSNNNEQRSIKISLVERNRFDPISNHIDVTKQLQTLESEDHILRPFRRRNEKIHLDHREQNRNFAANNYPWQLPMIELKRLTRTEETSMQNHSVLENRFDDRKKIVQPTIFINELDEREHLFRKRLPLLSNDEGFILTTIHNNVHNRTNSNSNNNNNAANQSIVNSSQNHQEISGSKEFHTNQNNLNLPMNVANNHHHINNNLNGRNNNQNEFNRRFGDLPVPPSSLLKPLPPPLFPNKPHNHHHHPHHHHHHHLQARAFDFNHSPMIPSLTPPSSIIPPSSMLFQKPNIGTREDVISLNDLESDDEFKTTARNNNNKIPDNADNSNEKNQLKAMLMNPLFNPNLPPFDRLPTGLQDLMPLFFDKFMAQLANGPQKQFLTNSSPMNSIESDITDLDEPNPMERQVVGNKPLSKPSMTSSPPPTTSTIRFANEIIPTGNEFDAEFGNFNAIENVPNNGGEWPKIFRFTDGRINLHDFERDKKRTRIKFNSKTGKAMFHIKRDSFLILHGGTFNQ